MTVAEWNEWYVTEYTEDKQSLSRFRRAKTSVKDDRPSAISVGALGIGVLSFSLALSLAADVTTILNFIRVST